MKAIPYISFNGNCEEAVKFYQSVLGGELNIMRYTEMPKEEDVSVSESWKNKIMHCSLTFDDGNMIYFSDTFEGSPVSFGTFTTVHLHVNSAETVHTVVTKLSEGGTITMPAQKTFWNAVYGSLIDRFGVNWGIDFEMGVR